MNKGKELFTFPEACVITEKSRQTFLEVAAAQGQSPFDQCAHHGQCSGLAACREKSKDFQKEAILAIAKEREFDFFAPRAKLC